MISKNFYVQLIIRVAGLVLLSLAAVFALLQFWYLAAGVAIFLLVAQTSFLIHHLNHTNRKIAYFFQSIKNEDFTLRFPEQLQLQSLKELNSSLNRVNGMIQEMHLRNKVQEQYYQEILKQADIGILTVNRKGHILFANATVEKLLNYTPLNHIKQLRQVNTNLYELFANLQPFERKMVQLTNEREKIELAIKSSSLVLNQEELLLVVVQDIHKELEEKETDSWIRLIRVLTHEIMNTITPITSISESILGYFRTDAGPSVPEKFNEEQLRNTVRGLEVIKEQGGDLMAFVQSYRSFLNVPMPDKTLVPARKLLNRLRLLMEQDFETSGIRMDIESEPADLDLYIDEKQISQVLINLCKNALQSLASQHDGWVTVKAGVNNEDKKYLSVTDNGPGIPQEQLEEIFVPFYTTKEKGTGIGLSLSKQILHLHRGNLQVHSDPGRETVFVLTF